MLKVVGTIFLKDNKLLIDKPRTKPTHQMIGGKVEEGETLTEYEAYTESVVTLSQPIELYGIGDVQDVIEDGKVKRKYEYLRVTGSDVKAITSYAETGNSISINILGKIDGKCLSNGFSGISFNDRVKDVNSFRCYVDPTSYIVFRVPVSENENFTNIDTVRRYFNENEIYIVYEMAEEVTEDLPLTDQIALSCLKTFHGVTYIASDGEVQTTFNSDYATNLEGAITLQAHADNRIGKANTLVNRAEGESDVFEVKVEHGLVYLYKDDVLHGILGANNVITNSETYKTMNVRAEEDADFIALTSAKNNNICYYMNINQIPFTSSHFKEAHYFGGDARFTGRVVGNEHIVAKNLQAQQMVFAQAVEASITLISKGDVTAANNIEAQNELKGKDLHFTNMGINGGAAQPVEWVWDSTLGRWVLCTVQEQGE